MNLCAAADALMRRKLFENIYSRMSDDDKRLLVQMTMENKGYAEIMHTLQSQQAQLDKIQRTQQTFGQDFLSNIAGNAAYEGLIWLIRRLLK